MQRNLPAIDARFLIQPVERGVDPQAPVPTDAQVQARFDREPAKLRELAGALASHTGDLATAARAHDAARAGALVDQLDPVCESCHLEFWYPDQKAAVEELLREPS